MQRLASVLLLAALFMTGPSLAAVAQESCPPPDAGDESTSLDMAGIENAQAAMSFIADLQDALRKDDDKKIASVIKYPFHLYDEGRIVKTFPSQENVLKSFSDLFTPGVRSAIMCTRDKRDWFVNDQGIMLGNGEVWIDGWGEGDPKAGSPILINAINP